jgi:uncharacterized protein YyaL (SSP411 family)
VVELSGLQVADRVIILMISMDTRPAIPWLAWSTEAFAAAHRGAKPVLLSIVTRWSEACRRFEHDVLHDPIVVDLVTDRFIPVRVDADRRPDIAERYTLGGWPTIASLTPGGEVMSGGTVTDASRFARRLVDLSEAFAARRSEIEELARGARRRRRDEAQTSARAGPGPDAPGPDASGLDSDAPRWLATQLAATFDRVWAGFGEGPKMPHASTLAFALTHGARTGDDDLVSLAVRTLDRVGWSALSDQDDGAFNRACLTREWTDPDTARLLDVQADLAGLFLEASVFLGEEAYALRARAALDYVVAVLEDAAEGGFFNSQAERREGPPIIDRVIVTSANARMVRTLVRAAEVLDEPRFAERAAATVERLVPAVYAAGAGLAHYLEDQPRVRGLLADQVDMSAALLDLSQASGNRVYRELAEELMRSCLRKLWCRDRGGFLDRLPTTSGGGDIGRMADPLLPLAANCEAARVLARLARETGDESLLVRAHETLASQTAAYRAHGVRGADYVLALAEVTLEAHGRMGA